MPVAANDLLKKLMVKAGIAYDGDLAAIPDDVANSVDNSLLTIAAATNNHPDVKKVYFAQAYNGLDAEIKTLMTEYGLDETAIKEIEAAGGSTKKAVALVRKIKDISDKAQPGDKEATKKLSDTITELNGKLAAEIAKQTELKATYDTDLKKIKIRTKLDGKTSKYKTVYDELDPVAKDAAMNALLDKALQDNDADFTFDDKGNLSITKKDGSNLFGENHTLITPDVFIDKTFSKILKVTPASNGKTTPASPVLDGEQKSNPALKAALSESLQSYEAASKVA